MRTKDDSTDVLRDFLKYVSFNILGQCAYSCYTLADTFFVSSSLGTKGLTALNLAFPVFCFLSGTGLMIGMGGGIRYSVLKSCGRHDRADRVFTNAVYALACFAVAYTLAGLFCSGQIVRLLGADDTVFQMTNTYLRVMLLFSPAFLLNNLLQCFVRNDGNPSLSMAAMIIGSFSNVVLDYIFIFPMRMGILGAILATGMAPLISMAVLSSCFIKRKNRFHLVRCGFGGKRTAEILFNGVPSLITEASSGIVMVVFNFIILRLRGNVGVAAYGVIAAISLVAVAIYTGLSQGIQPIISRCYGRGRTREVKLVLKYAVVTMLFLSGMIYGVLFFCASPIVLVFNSEGNKVLQQIAVTGLKLYFMACPLMGGNIVLSTYFSATEHPGPAQAISLLRGFFLLIPTAFLFSVLFGMAGVWCAFPFTELATVLLGIMLYAAERKREAKKETGELKTDNYGIK